MSCFKYPVYISLLRSTFLFPFPLPLRQAHFSIFRCTATGVRSPESASAMCHVPCAKWQVLEAASSGIHTCTHTRTQDAGQPEQPFSNAVHTAICKYFPAAIENPNPELELELEPNLKAKQREQKTTGTIQGNRGGSSVRGGKDVQGNRASTDPKRIFG